MDLKDYKKILEEENKKGDEANIKRIEEAKNKLLSEEENLEETSNLLFSLENHTIEYSIQMLDDYLKDKNEIDSSEKTENKKIKDSNIDYKKLFIEIIVIILSLITIFLVIYFFVYNK